MLSNYLLFLRSPVYLSKTYAVQWREMLTMFVLYIAISFPLGIVIGQIAEQLDLDHRLTDIGTTEIWLAILLVPAVEELLFRLWLKVDQRTLFSSAILILLTIALFVQLVSYWITVGLLVIGIVALVIAVLDATKRIEKIVARYFNILFYSSVLLFGIVHIFNYLPLTWQTWLLAPILVSPQLILGSMLGFIRVRYGILYAILFHMMVNALLFAVFSLGR